MKSSIQSKWYHILNFAILTALIGGPALSGQVSFWWIMFILVGQLRHNIISTNGGVERHAISHNVSGMALMTYNVISHTLFWPMSYLALFLRRFQARLKARADFAK